MTLILFAIVPLFIIAEIIRRLKPDAGDKVSWAGVVIYYVSLAYFIVFYITHITAGQ